VPDSGTLSPAFASSSVLYTISLPNATTSISLTPTVHQAGATVTVNTVPGGFREPERCHGA